LRGERSSDPEAIAEALERVRSRIESAGGDPDAIRIVAVTKSFGPDTARAALAAGLHTLGENYATELLEKAEALKGEDVAWHFLGAIQTNKIGRLAPVTSVFESLARVREAEALALRKPGASVMVQVELTGLPGRNGSPRDEVSPLVSRATSLGLRVEGLMTVAPVEPDRARRAFRSLRELCSELGLAECSMGMSDDLELAVGEGSTMLRIGRALFGPRTPPT
jgi:uncharacterized pyridoxal phosphate-containing UPF0001 family protein